MHFGHKCRKYHYKYHLHFRNVSNLNSITRKISFNHMHIVVLLFPVKSCVCINQYRPRLPPPSDPAHSSSGADPPEPLLCHVPGPGHAALHRHHAHRRALLLQQVRCSSLTSLCHRWETQGGSTWCKVLMMLIGLMSHKINMLFTQRNIVKVKCRYSVFLRFI